MITPTRSQSNACFCALPIRWVTSNRWATSSSGASIQWSTSSIGTTSTCPRASGLIDMNATQRSSRYTNVPGISPAMIRLKMVVMVPNVRSADMETTGAEPLPHGAERVHARSTVLHPVVPVPVVRPRQPIAGAAWLLGGLGATDWVDGWLARRLNQTSEFGKMFDPTADRLLFIIGIGGIIVDGAAPLWVCWAVVIREVLVGGTVAIAPRCSSA